MKCDISNADVRPRERWSHDDARSRADGTLMSQRHLAKSPDDLDGMAPHPIIDILAEALPSLHESRGGAS